MTLSYGVRYEISHGRRDRFNRLAHFEYDPVNSIGAQGRIWI